VIRRFFDGPRAGWIMVGLVYAAAIAAWWWMLS
jgi:hypothetical protein